MKAAVCREFGQPLVIEDLELDPPQANEVQVKIKACAICHSDIHYAEGAWGGQLPAVYGHEAAGVVVDTGQGVGTVRRGDHVVVTLVRSCGTCFFCRRGSPHLCETIFPLDERGRLHSNQGEPVLQALRTAGFAEEVVVHESQVVAIPNEMSMESASLMACGVITGLGAVVNTAKVPTGSSVVVVGTGGVGLNAVQGAVLSGASPIIALDVLDNKLAAARDFGATHTVNPAQEDAAAAIRALTGGRGADYVFVTVGSGPAMQAAPGYLRKIGTLVLVGMPASGVKLALEAANLADAEHIVMGSKMGSSRIQNDIPKLVELYQQGRLKLDELVTETYPLEQINDAISAVTRGEALRNVIVFE
jgi:Zn-dependent alcohol dehydrogenase